MEQCGLFDRFIKRQEKMYPVALEELKAGKKCGHWIWYTLPQIRGLARSRKAFVFGIPNAEYARQYLAHPILGPRLIQCCQTILTHKEKTARQILGDLDALKLRSCATLFAMVSREGSVFHQVLDQFYEGRKDPFTLGLVSGTILDMTYRKFLVAVDL